MPRLTREDYLREGLVILGESGSDGLTIAALCDRLHVTKGSFYHHFGGTPGYNAAVLEYWENEYNNRLIATVAAEDPLWLIPLLTSIAVSLPHATEAAIRAWGKSNEDARRCQERVDAARERRIFEVISSLGVSDAKSRLLTDMATSILIGFQHRAPEDTPRLRKMLDEANRLIFIEANQDA